MSWLGKLGRRLGAPFRRERLDREMDEEMRFHLEMQEKENVAAGLPPEEARYAALRSFGGLDQVKEASRQQRTAVWLEDFLGDLRYGLRMLRKSPGFTAVAVLTLAIGIGANTSIFSCANAILFQPLPFPASDRLVAITALDTHLLPWPASPGDFFEWRQEAHSFASLAVLAQALPYNLTGTSEPQSVAVQLVSANYFSTLGVRPAAGRDFRPEEDTRGKSAVVILSHGFWLRQFGGSPEAIGQTIELNGQAATIIGIMPANFTYESAGMDLWGTAVLSQQNHGARYFHVVVGRLKPGVTVSQAQSEMSVIADRLAKQFPDTDKGYGAKVVPLLEDYVGNLRPSLVALLVAVGFLLLICCVNIANLLLARALARQKEIVIRAALGAGRGRVVRQFLTESLLLAALGGGLGILIAEWGTRLLTRFAPLGPRLNEISLNGRALAFTGLLTLVTGVAFGLVPAIQATRLDLNDALKAGARGSTKGGSRARGLLVVFEIALALVLLIGAGLFVRSLIRLQRVDPGFQASNTYAANVTLPKRKYATSAQLATFTDQVIARLSDLPGVQAAGAAQNLPLLGGNTQFFTVAGWPMADPTKLPTAVATLISATYCRTMGIPLLRGRFFTEHDIMGAPSVALINEAMARRYFANVNPIGQRLGIMTGGSQPDHWDEIVGVVGGVKAYTLQDDPNLAELYEANAQRPSRYLTFVVHAAAAVPGLPTEIHTAIAAVDKDQSTIVVPLADIVKNAFSSMDFAVFLFTAFSAAGLGLGGIGIYGVMAYFVTQRTSEIGIRMALGAQRGDIMTLVFSQAAQLIAWGVLAGLAGALALTRFLQSMLYGVGTRDPITFGGVAVLLAAVALLAGLIPALRALRISPIVALRYE